MSDDDVLTEWLQRLADADHQAAEVIWQNYFIKLVAFARRRMRDMPRRSVDEEDIATSAMFSFCRGITLGKFGRLKDRSDLWKLLVTIAARKIYGEYKSSRRMKRGGGRVRGESAFGERRRSEEGDGRGLGIEQVVGNEPSPELAAMVVEKTHCLLNALSDTTERKIALLKLEGYNNREIADELGCARRTVERKLIRIRTKWRHFQTGVDS